MAVSQAKLSANRRNAQKSTGPKSLEGKKKVSGNALTHGLTAQAVRTPEDLRRIDKRVVEWVTDMQPDNKTELSLITIAAEASVRLETALTLEGDVFAYHINGAVDRFTRDRQFIVQEILKDTSLSFTGRVAALRKLAYGCDWLIDQWLDLKGILETPRPLAEGVRRAGEGPSLQDGSVPPCATGSASVPNPSAQWTLPQLHAALVLLGFEPNVLSQPNAPLPRLDRAPGILLVLDFALNPDRLHSEALANHLRTPKITPEQAYNTLLQFIHDERTALEARQQELWLDVEEPAMAKERISAALQAAKDALIFKRYQSSAASDMHRTLDRVAKLRKDLIRPRSEMRNKANFAATQYPETTSTDPSSASQRPPAPPRTAPPTPYQPINNPAPMETPHSPHNRHDTNLSMPVS